MAGKPKFKPSQVAKAIRMANGLLSVAAHALGCSREAVRNYTERYPVCRKAVQEAREVVLDVAEGKLMEQIRNGNLSAIALALKTIGKARGYVERTEIEHDGQIAEERNVHIYLPDNGRDTGEDEDEIGDGAKERISAGRKNQAAEGATGVVPYNDG